MSLLKALAVFSVKGKLSRGELEANFIDLRKLERSRKDVQELTVLLRSAIRAFVRRLGVQAIENNLRRAAELLSEASFNKFAEATTRSISMAKKLAIDTSELELLLRGYLNQVIPFNPELREFYIRPAEFVKHSLIPIVENINELLSKRARFRFKWTKNVKVVRFWQEITDIGFEVEAPHPSTLAGLSIIL